MACLASSYLKNCSFQLNSVEILGVMLVRFVADSLSGSFSQFSSNFVERSTFLEFGVTKLT